MDFPFCKSQLTSIQIDAISNTIYSYAATKKIDIDYSTE